MDNYQVSFQSNQFGDHAPEKGISQEGEGNNLRMIEPMFKKIKSGVGYKAYIYVCDKS